MKKSQKFRWFIFPSMVIVFAFAFSPFFVSKTSASPAPNVVEKTKPVTSKAGNQLIIEKVGLYVLGITELNVAAGSYNMDVYLNFNCNLACNPDPNNAAFDIMNAPGASDISEQTSDTQGNTIH